MMTLVADRRLMLSKDQIVTSSQASRNFGEVKRRAAKEPQFISGRSGIDAVIVGFEEYERLCVELEDLRAEKTYAEATRRLESAPERVSLREAMGDDAYEAFLAIDPDSIPDEDLFE